MSGPEGAVVSACLEYLHACKIMAWRNNTGAAVMKTPVGRTRFVRYGLVGSSDIIGLLPDGRFLAVECKADKGRLSDAQAAFLADVRGNNGVAVVAKSSDDVAAVLTAEGYGI